MGAATAESCWSTAASWTLRSQALLVTASASLTACCAAMVMISLSELDEIASNRPACCSLASSGRPLACRGSTRTPLLLLLFKACCAAAGAAPASACICCMALAAAAPPAATAGVLVVCWCWGRKGGLLCTSVRPMARAQTASAVVRGVTSNWVLG